MKRMFVSFIAVLLCATIGTSSVFSVAAATDGKAKILSTEMNTNEDDSNVKEYYYSNEEWTKVYPNGGYIVEYDSYGVYEGGDDADNPQDVYLGINVYRVGGNNESDTVTYHLTGVSVDEELYPESMGEIHFEPQQEKAVAKVRITNDNERKGEQVMMFTLEKANKGVISPFSAALITVTDDEPYVDSEIKISVSDTIVDMAEGGAEIALTRSKNISEYSTLTIYTTDGSAKEGTDYEKVEKEIVFYPDESEKIVTIPFIQSDKKFTEPKSFKVSVKDLKGCVVTEDNSVQVKFTNKLEAEARKLTEVTPKADLEINNDNALSDSSNSVININDNLDRASMLSAAIGSAGGENIKPFATASMRAASNQSWNDYVVVDKTDFETIYNNGEKWEPVKQYNDGNQDLMIVSNESYDLNQFSDVYYSFQNHRVAANGHPNTAVGYMLNDGTHFNSKKFSYTKGSLKNNSDLDWMKKNNTYVIDNFNCTNIDKSNGDFLKENNSFNTGILDKILSSNFMYSGKRMPNTVGLEAKNQSLFFMLYDDKGWDDHHFSMDYAILKRDVIPVEIFQGKGVTDFEVKNGVLSFIKEGYRYSIEPDPKEGGITSCDKSKSPIGYGFYAGSELKVSFSPVSTMGQSAPVPEYVFFTDSNGVVHMSSKVENSTFKIKLETIMSNNENELRNQYYMSEDEAKAHASLFRDNDNLISSRFEGALDLDVRYSIKQSFELSYKDVPVLVDKAILSNGNIETEAEYEQRVFDVLEGVVEFYLNGEEVTPNPLMDKTNNRLQYAEVEYDYIRITPSAMGVGAVVTSNLSDVDYSRIVASTDISEEICLQNSSNVSFAVLDEKTTFVNPRIALESVSVSTKNGEEFSTEYVANNIDRNLPFESFYFDTSQNNSEISYYTLDFYISDIYVAGALDCAPKEYLVTVYNEDTTNEKEKEPLFKFIFTGGRAISKSEDVTLYNLNSCFTKNDALQVPDNVKLEDFKPFVKLTGFSNEGYKYKMYIPSFFNYQGGNELSNYYPTVFSGNDGVRMEVSEISEGSSKNFSAIKEGSLVDAKGANDMQYLAPQLPAFDTEASESELESQYFDAQQDFSTYRENCLLLGSPNLNIDCSNITTFIAKIIGSTSKKDDYDKQKQRLTRCAGSGISIKLGSDSINIIAKISYAPQKLKSEYANVPYTFGDGSKVKNESERALQTGTNSTYAAGTIGVAAEANLQINYDTISHRYVFSKIMFTGSATASFSATIPTSIPAVFFGISTSITGSIGVGYAQVLNYVDTKGVSHYKGLFGGIPISVGVNITGTLGIGFAGVVAVEGGISFDASVAFVLANHKFIPEQSEMDIAETSKSTETYKVSYTGDWKVDYQGKSENKINVVAPGESYRFGETLVTSNKVGDTCTIKTKATAIQLTGVVSKSGGVMEVTVEDTHTGKILDKRQINTYSEKTKYGATIYTYNLDDYRNTSSINMKVTIKQVGDTEDGRFLALDSIRITNPEDSKDYVESGSFTNFYFKIALAIKLTLGPIKLAFDPAYMQFNLTSDKYSITLGTLGYSKTTIIDRKSARMLEAGEEQDIPLLVADSTKVASKTNPDYFELSEYGSEKDLKLLAGDIDVTADIKSVYHNGKVYSFFASTSKDQDGKCTYRLYCSIDGKEAKPVTESESYINEFTVFEDNQGKLYAQLIAADSTVSHLGIAENGETTVYYTNGKDSLRLEDSEDLGEFLESMCVKIAVFDENEGTFLKKDTVVIPETDSNSRVESIPSTAQGSSKASVVFYVIDQKTNVDADYNINNDSDVEGIRKDLDNTKALYDTVYSGRSELRYAVLKDGKLSESAAVNANPSEAELKAGYKITEVSAVMADDSNLCLSYKAEIPYAVMKGQSGTLKEVYWQNGKLDNNGNLTLDKRVTVASVMDFDNSIADFEDAFSDEELTEDYYNPDSGEYYSEIILGHLDMKKANIRELKDAEGKTSTEPCLFYATNKSINYVTYDKIKKALEGEKADVGVLYNDHFEEYVVAVSENGSVNLVYASETEKYQDSLYCVFYDSSNDLWTKPIRLTHSDVFDENAFEDYETTATLNFDTFDAFVNNKGEINVTLRSAYTPFVYKYGAEPSNAYGDTSVDAFANADYEYEDENGETVKGIVYATLDPSSELARSDVFSLTFKNPRTMVNVDSFSVVNPVFVKGESVNASFDVVNTGDTTIKEMMIDLVYYDIDSGATNRIKYQKFTGALLAGDRMSVDMLYQVDNYIGDNVLLGVRITDGMDVLYHSYNDSYLKSQSDKNLENIAYHEINTATELGFLATRADIDSNGIMSFTAEVESYGTLSPSDDVMLYCKAYDDEADGEYIGTIFAYSIPASKLQSGSIASVSSKSDVSSYLTEDKKLYYRFELKTNDKQYTTDNDKTSISTGVEHPEISMNSSEFAVERLRTNANAHPNTLSFDMMLGDEITINSDIIGSTFDVSQLSIYEVGSDCLSISHNPLDGNIKIKAISLPDGKSGVVKAIVHLRNTSVYRYLYINVSNRSFVDFNEQVADKDWTVTGQYHVYAVNFDLAQTAKQGSEINFKYFGDSIEIVGDKLTNGGDFEITITDKSGKEVEKNIISTKDKLNDFGKILYKGQKHGFGEYNVKIKAVLDEGEKLSFDRAEFNVDRSDADVTPYNTVNDYVENLDAPLVNGRQRKASFSLNFNKNIALADEKQLSDLTLKFKELKGDGDTFEETGKEVVFTASKISGKTLVFTAPLESEAGYVMKYILADSEIPSGFVVDEENNPTDTKIPDYDLVSYILKESGILSVSVCDDDEMPDGSVQKSVQVKFITIPDKSRLEGTKLLYKTVDHEGKESTVEFKFAEITNDPRVALYRADRLTLSDNELEKTFSFESGIVLNSKNYVLVTADGDYLDNDITTIYEKSDLNITYVKAKAVSTDIRVSVKDSVFKPSVYITFNEAIDLQGATNNATVLLEETTVKDGVETSRELKLFAESIDKDGKTLVFRTNEGVSISQADTVKYSVISDRIKYEYNNTFVVTSKEKISINPYIKADEVSFNTNGYIESITPYEDNSGTVYAKVTFTSELTEESLINTFVTLNEKIEEYSREIDSTVTLDFESSEVLIAGDKVRTFAVYKSSQPGEAILEYGEVAKTFTAAQTLGVKGTLTDVNGTEYTCDVLSAESFKNARVQAQGGEIRLLENGDSGYHAELSLTFEENISVKEKDGVFSTLIMTEGKEEKELVLYLDSADNNTLKFRTQVPFTFENGVVTTFTPKERFLDRNSFVTTENGVGVSEKTGSVKELVIDNTYNGQVINTNVILEKVDREHVKAIVKVKYKEVLRELSFKDASLEAFINLLYSDGSTNTVKKTLEFEGLEGSNTATFSTIVEISADIAEIQLTPGESITPLGTGRLYDENRTLALSEKLNDIKRAKVKRVVSDTTAIIPLEDEEISSLADVVVAVSYPSAISVENIEGITLKVKVDGVKGKQEVIFKAREIYHEKHLVFHAENAENLTLANVVTLSVENAVLQFADTSCVTVESSGMDVNPKIVDVSETFVTKSTRR